MRVFVWVSYGDASVYAASTSAELRFIYSEVRKVLEEFGEELGETPDLLTDIGERETLMIIDAFGGYDVHESFEFGTGFTTVIGR